MIVSLTGKDSPGDAAAREGAAAPHRPLLSYYAEPEARPDFVRRLFDSTADSYDGINRVLSFGSGGWYRRQALLRAGLRPGARMLDVAIGTGLVAREAVRILGEPGHVIGLDPSAGMLGVAARSLGIRLVQARAEAMPIAGGSMDFLSMGYALRHVSDLALAFAEFQRVLRPGGRLLLLELARPESRLGYAVARAYLGGVVPALSRLAGTESGKLMRYYWDTIDACVPAAEIMRRLRESGLQEVACRTEFGIFRAYTASRPTN